MLARQILHVGTPQAKSDAITTLSNLSTTGNTLSTILSCFPIPSLVDILNTFKKSSKTVEKCVALLESLMPFEHARVSLTSEPGGVLSVVEALEDGSSRTKEHAVGALLTLCKSDCCRYREVILNEGAIPGLLELTVQGTDKARPKARELLQILRGSKDRRSEMEGETLEDIVNDIVCGIEGEDRSGKAKRMLAEMVKVSMEQSLRHLERRASVVCTTPTAELATLK
ncbi:U-box domain-containing protein 3-like [Asparagus officinalis]|uniref:U-box domain-containing protein 3-like n=1 Tax=Asparagus officinalis TaxID=4686 RepID=UPI00098DEB95|nr:U-box domain-containing protein 3-like [Asparagus officinalis]XP_020265305.1 U-box domain-containing protein 3-like [Asparagus officinalis]